jgi:hypothetical protein
MADRHRPGLDETDTEAEAVPSPADGVISGETHPPDEHTRRVEASKRRRKGDDTRTMQKAWDQEEIRAPTVSSPERRPMPERKFLSGKETGGKLFGPPRQPEANSREAAMGRDGAVRAYGRDGAGMPTPDSRQPDRTELVARPHPERTASERYSGHEAAFEDEAPTELEPPKEEVHAQPVEIPQVAVMAVPMSASSAGGDGGEGGNIASDGAEKKEPSTREYADRSIRQRKKERDRRAEKTALRMVIGAFFVVGVGGYLLINSDLVSGPDSDRVREPEREPKNPPLVKTEVKPKNLSSHFEETPDIPALRALTSEGLTIAAEGIPEVTANDPSPQASLAAAVETCRFAYGVWEFSPNKRFRFLTTCGAFEGQTLVGAYEVQGSRVRMSPLIDGGVEIVSEFEVEKPSRIKSEIKVTQGERALRLDANQRVTTIRGGMEGEGFRDTYTPKNTLSLPGQKKGAAQEGAAPRPGKDPLLDLIKQKGR